MARRREGGGGKAGVTKKDKGGQEAKTDIKLFLREAPVHLSKTASHSNPVFVHEGKSTFTISSGHTVC